MMTAEFDLFFVFRWILVTVCTIYAAAQVGQSLWRWLDYFAGSRRTAVLGHYVMVQLLRLRLRRFGFELLQIVVLLVVLGCLVYGHRLAG